MEGQNVKPIDLTRKLGINKSSISLYLNGKTGLSYDKIESLLNFLNIKLVIENRTHQ